jgi:hypothetical protein
MRSTIITSKASPAARKSPSRPSTAASTRRHQRIAEQALERGAGDRERGADQHGGQHARPAHQQDDVLDCRRDRRWPLPPASA